MKPSEPRCSGGGWGQLTRSAAPLPESRRSFTVRLQLGGWSAGSTCSSEQRSGLHISDQGRWGRTRGKVRWGPLSARLPPAASRKASWIDHKALGIGSANPRPGLKARTPAGASVFSLREIGSLIPRDAAEGPTASPGGSGCYCPGLQTRSPARAPYLPLGAGTGSNSSQVPSHRAPIGRLLPRTQTSGLHSSWFISWLGRAV